MMSQVRHKTILNSKLVSIFVSLMIILLILGEALNGAPGFWQYVDEISFVVLLVVLLTKVIRGVCKQKIVMGVGLLSIVTVLGLLGNILFSVQPDWSAIAIDWCSMLKAPVVFLAVYDLLSFDSAHEIALILKPICKFLILSSAFFGTVSLFVNLGMGGEPRFGITSFVFVFKYQHCLAIILISSLLLLSIAGVKEATLLWYYALVAYSMLLTTKGPSLIWVAVLGFLLLGASNKFKFKPWHMIPVALVAVLLGGYQINNYLLDSTAPRHLLIEYGFVTANNYLPTGSGFATYGSDMAAKAYSSLYYQYGFAELWGMGPVDSMFLCDNYWPMVIGQFGYVGLALVIAIYVLIFSIIQNGTTGKISRCIAISNCLYIAVHSLGSASLTSSAGVLLIAVLAIASCTKKVRE